MEPTYGSIHIANGVELGYIDQSRQNLNTNNTIWEEILDGHYMNEEIYINEKKQIQPRQYVKQFNFGGKSQEKLISFLSGGERNRVHLAKSLRNACNILLNGPSNDLDVDTVRKLEECMETFRGIVMVISHDRYFLDRVCTHLIAFDNNGKVQWFEGNYSQYLKFKNYQKKYAKLDAINGANNKEKKDIIDEHTIVVETNDENKIEAVIEN